MSNTIQNPVSDSSNKLLESKSNDNNKNNSKNNNQIDAESLLSKQHSQISIISTSSSSSKDISLTKNSTNNNNTKKIEKKGSSSNIIKVNDIKQAKISSSKRKSKKNMCFHPDCTKSIAKFIGDCNFCNGHFCSSHRLMESHNCKGLATCKEQLHKRNADKLTKEQTIVSKIQI